MMRFVRSCLQSLLKLVNSMIGLMGMGMTLYSFWMLRIWYKQVHSFWASSPDSTLPWFIYTFLGLGVSLCMISCAGYISAETANGCCLSCYIVFVFLLVMLEAAISAEVFLNRDWAEDFPEDTTGRFNELKKFVGSNFEMCKWIALMVVSAQALSIFLAMLLKSLGPYHGNYYDSDDDYISARLPLLRNQVQHSPYICEAHPSLINDYWNVKGYYSDSRWWIVFKRSAMFSLAVLPILYLFRFQFLVRCHLGIKVWQDAALEEYITFGSKNFD